MEYIYFDNVSSTQPDKKVMQAMLPFLYENYGNPSSIHKIGQISKNALHQAREQTAELINANADEIVFTSCGSESNNFALRGIAYANKQKGNHIITSQIEHHSVIQTLKELEKQGFEVTYLSVDKFGFVNPEDVKNAITDKTILVSVMYANAEVGTIQPIEEISAITREKGICLHSDAVAAVGSIEVKVKDLGVDLLSFSASQFYGPKGIAALYIRKGIKIMPLIYGGVQEFNKRAGTENIAGAVGMGMAAKFAKESLQERQDKLKVLRDKLIKGILDNIPNIYLNGHPVKRLPGNVNISVEFVEGESMLLFLDMDGIAAASGSSCTSKKLKASHVLLAMGIEPAIAQGSLLFSLGKDNTEQEVDYLIKKLPPIVERLRQMSPLT